MRRVLCRNGGIVEGLFNWLFCNVLFFSILFLSHAMFVSSFAQLQAFKNGNLLLVSHITTATRQVLANIRLHCHEISINYYVICMYTICTVWVALHNARFISHTYPFSFRFKAKLVLCNSLHRYPTYVRYILSAFIDRDKILIKVKEVSCV